MSCVCALRDQRWRATPNTQLFRAADPAASAHRNRATVGLAMHVRAGLSARTRRWSNGCAIRTAAGGTRISAGLSALLRRPGLSPREREVLCCCRAARLSRDRGQVRPQHQHHPLAEAVHLLQARIPRGSGPGTRWKGGRALSRRRPSARRCAMAAAGRPVCARSHPGVAGGRAGPGVCGRRRYALCSTRSRRFSSCLTSACVNPRSRWFSTSTISGRISGYSERP